MQRVLHLLLYFLGLIVFVLGSTLFLLDHKDDIARKLSLRNPVEHESTQSTSSPASMRKATTTPKAVVKPTVPQTKSPPKAVITPPAPPAVTPVKNTVVASQPTSPPPTSVVPVVATSSLATTTVNTIQKIDSATPSSVGALNQADIFALSNVERVKAGLAPLTFSAKLSEIAIAKSKDMNAKQYFAHVSPSGVDIGMLAVEFGYEYLNIGENLALGNFDSSQDVVTGWMNSPGHRANILHTSYTEIGIGVIVGTYEGRQVWFAVQEFGRPMNACPQADQVLKQRITVNQEQLRIFEATMTTLRAEIESSGLSQAEYNKKANEYNAVVVLYNNVVATTKQDITAYNMQADVYNACLGLK